jgi:hypothetical protein
MGNLLMYGSVHVHEEKGRKKTQTHTFNGLLPQARKQKHAKDLFAREKMLLFAGYIVRTHYVDRSILCKIIMSYVNNKFQFPMGVLC